MRPFSPWIATAILLTLGIAEVMAQAPPASSGAIQPGATQPSAAPASPTQYAPLPGLPPVSAAAAPLDAQGVPQMANTPGAGVPGAMPAPAPPQAPFLLTPEQEKYLHDLLLIWQRESDKIQLFESKFTLHEYDATQIPAVVQSDGRQVEYPRRICFGEVRYAKPDKGYYSVTMVKNAAPHAQRVYEYQESKEPGEKWICDGQAIYEFRAEKKQVVERRLPPELMGKAISDGPLPFVFGIEAEKLKRRYWLRIVTPPGDQQLTWIEAWPKFRADAANYQRIEIILRNQDLMPHAVQVYMPNHTPQKKVSNVYVFDQQQVNGVLSTIGNFMGFFVRPNQPFGWTWTVDDPAAQGGAQPPPGSAQPAAAPTRPGIFSRLPFQLVPKK